MGPAGIAWEQNLDRNSTVGAFGHRVYSAGVFAELTGNLDGVGVSTLAEHAAADHGVVWRCAMFAVISVGSEALDRGLFRLIRET